LYFGNTTARLVVTGHADMFDCGYGANRCAWPMFLPA
jgi:hypothetical protein